MEGCDGCADFDKTFTEVENYKLDGYDFQKFNVLDSMEFTKSLNIATTPSIILYVDDAEIDRINIGLDRNEFLKFIFQDK